MMLPLLAAVAALLVAGAVLAVQASLARRSAAAHAARIGALARQLGALDREGAGSSPGGPAARRARLSLLHAFALEQRAATHIASAARRHWRALCVAVAAGLAAAALVGAVTPGLDVDTGSTVPASASTAPEADLAALEAAYGKLRAFVENGPSETLPANMSSATGGSGRLPDVETAIDGLAARLAARPDDVDGWRMLGWSYFQTQRYALAVEAYGQAVALQPESESLKAGLAEAQAKVAAGGNTTPGPSADDIAAARTMSEADRQQMIVAMVERLTSRLAAAPRDEDGWIRLARARLVLGDRAAAEQALEGARKAFADDPAALARLAAAATQLGAGVR